MKYFIDAFGDTVVLLLLQLQQELSLIYPPHDPAKMFIENQTIFITNIAQTEKYLVKSYYGMF